MYSDLEKMAERIRIFMRRSIGGENLDDEFNRLALQLFAAQKRLNDAYGRLCDQRVVGPVETWQDIPAAPTFAFKELELTSLDSSERTEVFYSSGTTQRDRSRHFHSPKSLSLYEESLWLWFEKQFAGKLPGVRSLFLTPTRGNASNSSLVHMFEAIANRLGGAAEFAGIIGADGSWVLDLPTVRNYMTTAEASRTPMAILGTAFLFVHLLDSLASDGTKIQLPAGSWILETGGYKGRSREVPKEELHRFIVDRLGVAPDQIFGEYGMSELSSQAYAGADGLFRFPPWARAQIVSPATRREAREGEPGLIRVFDLANVWSVMAVQTEDIGIKEGDAVRLVGRAAQAEARGCSLMAA